MKHLFITLLLMGLLPTQADTVEVYAHQNDDLTQISSDLKKKGYQVERYDIDAVSLIEEELSIAVTQALKESIEAAKKTDNSDQLSEDDITNFVIRNYNDKTNDDRRDMLDKLTGSVGSRTHLAVAWRAKIKSEEHGLTDKDLPALVFKHKIYRNVTNIRTLSLSK